MKIKWLPQFQYTVAAIRPHPIYQFSGLNVSKRAYNINLNCEYIGLALFLFFFFAARIFITKVHLFNVFVLTQLLFLSDDLKARLSAIQCFYSTIFIAYSFYMAVPWRLTAYFSTPCVIFCVWFELVHYFIVFSNKSVSFHLLFIIRSLYFVSFTTNIFTIKLELFCHMLIAKKKKKIRTKVKSKSNKRMFTAFFHW